MPNLLYTKLFVPMFLLTLMPMRASAKPDRSDAPLLSVSLFNDAKVAPEVLAQAQSRASLVLEQAGIRVRWLNCSSAPLQAPGQFQRPSACSSIAFPSHLSVRILGGTRRLPGEDIFGQSFLDASGIGAYANVYYQHIAASGLQSFLSNGEILGYVIAHEVGHLLLGVGSHSPAGLMCARWSPAQLRLASKGLVFFTVAQSALMRSRL